MDPDKMAAREKKFGRPLLSAKDPKDPEAMKKRAAKFGKPVKASSGDDDEARKKVSPRGLGGDGFMVACTNLWLRVL